jgi:hypothetical protein
LQKISTLNEKPLHEALKRWYTQPGDRLEAPVDRFIIDIMRGDLLVEIQTRNLGAIRQKLEKLAVHHTVRLVYPIAGKKWIIRQAESDHHPISRRKSPKQGTFEHAFDELVSLPKLLMNPNVSIELLLIEEEEVRRYDANRAWRKRGWVTFERRLLRVTERRILKTAKDMKAFIPAALVEPFSTSDLAISLVKPRRLAQRMIYCLRLTGGIIQVGKRGNSILYGRCGD